MVMGITPIIHMLCFVLINIILMNLLCVLIFLWMRFWKPHQMISQSASQCLTESCCRVCGEADRGWARETLHWRLLAPWRTGALHGNFQSKLNSFTTQRVSDWSLVSCPQHGVTSGWSNSAVSKRTFRTLLRSKALLKSNQQNQSIHKYKTKLAHPNIKHRLLKSCCY